MKRTWIVSGTWDRNGEPGWVTLHCDTRAEADALARARGLTVIEAMCAGGDPAATTTTHPPTSHAPKPSQRAKPTAPIAHPPPPHAKPPGPAVAKFAPLPPVVAPPPHAGATPQPHAPARHMSPARQAAIEADPSADGRWSAASGLVFLAVGLLVVIVGTYLTTSPLVGHWTGEFVQLIGAAAVLIGLRILSS